MMSPLAAVFGCVSVMFSHISVQILVLILNVLILNTRFEIRILEVLTTRFYSFHFIASFFPFTLTQKRY